VRMLHIGSASAFQAEGVSSILIIRSNKKNAILAISITNIRRIE